MHICFIANANSVHTQRWIEPLLDKGHHIDLISYQTIRSNYKQPEVNKIDLTQIIDTPRLRWVIWGFWIKSYINRLNPDILHAHQIQAAGWLGFISNFHPFIVTAWGSDLLLYSKSSRVKQLMIRKVLASCDGLTVPSELLYNAAIELDVPSDRIYLIPWGIETDIFGPIPDDRLQTRLDLGIDLNAEVIFCPRGISPLYNIKTVIVACESILDAHPHLILLLLQYNADQDYFDELQHYINDRQLDNTVLWIPSQNSYDAMASLYRSSDITISIPSSEGYGFSVYEAMATGCPTIITDLPLHRDEFQHGIQTLKVPVADAKETANAIHRLLTDKHLQQTLTSNSHKLVDDKSVDFRINKVLSLYEDIKQ